MIALRPVALVLLLSAAQAAVASPCAPISFRPAHASALAAVTTTLEELVRDRREYESGGFVVEQNGRFRSSHPVTQRSRTAVDYCILLPRGAKLAAIYHTHVGDPEFSPRDRQNAERAGVPSYIGTIDGGQLFSYDPVRRREIALGATASRRGESRALEEQSRPLAAFRRVIQRLAAAFR